MWKRKAGPPARPIPDGGKRVHGEGERGNPLSLRVLSTTWTGGKRERWWVPTKGGGGPRIQGVYDRGRGGRREGALPWAGGSSLLGEKGDCKKNLRILNIKPPREWDLLRTSRYTAIGGISIPVNRNSRRGEIG